MATIRLLLGIICLAVFGSFIGASGDFLGQEVRTGLDSERKNKVSRRHPDDQNILPVVSSLSREKIIAIARLQFGIREASGKNDGKVVETYLSYTGNRKGEPWCASFVSWVYGKAGFAQPKTSWSPALFPVAKQTLNPLPADVFGIYYFRLRRIAHCGLIETFKGNWVKTIEGNTNDEGAREGEGVYSKLRHKRTIAVYANWLNHLKKGERK